MTYYININQLLKLKPLNELTIRDDFKYYDEIENIIKTLTKTNLRNRLWNIYYFIVYEVDDSINWVERLNIIVNELGRDSSSLRSFQIRYGDKIGLEKFNEKLNKTKPNLDKFKKEYGDELGIIEWNRRYENNGQSLLNCLKRYGKNEGKRKWDEYLMKRNKTYQNNKLNGKKYRNGRTLNECISLYGEEEGRKLYSERNEKQSKRFSKKHYVDLYGEEDGNLKWDLYRKDMNKTSPESFIERYGIEEGIEKYREQTIIKKYHNSLEYYMEKYGKEEGKKEWDDYRDRTIFKKQRYSKISQKLFWSIYDRLDINMRNNVKFAELNKEWFVRNDKSIYFFDFVLNKIVIEFDGEYWHKLEKTMKNDKIKDRVLFDSGYKLLRIDERDYLNNEELVIERSLSFIKENYGK